MADGPTDDASTTPAENSDEFDGLVFDDEFVRGGTYEPPARTRVAIAKYGDEPTSWRHGGGTRKSQPSRAPETRGGRRPRQRASSRSSHSALPSPAMARLPLIITVLVVAVAAFLVFR